MPPRAAEHSAARGVRTYAATATLPGCIDVRVYPKRCGDSPRGGVRIGTTAEDYMNAIQIALGAAIGAVIGVVIGDVTHLTGYWPHIVVALCAAAGVFVAHAIWPRK